jgi:hypothetical protein
MRISISALAFLAAAAAAVAQDPVVLGNAAGAAYPLGSVGFPVEPPILYTNPLALSPDANVYASLDGSLPAGRYLFDVVDVNFVNLSHLPAQDRVFVCAKVGGLFAMARESGTPGLPGVGVGVAGGDSMPLFPFNSPQPVAGRPDLLCVQKVLMYQLDAAGVASFVGFRHFRVGNGGPATISGVVFEDLDQNGVRGGTEPGIGGATIQLVSNTSVPAGQVVATTVTAANGTYSFTNVGIDDCSVVLQLNTQLYVATTPTDVRLYSCGCASQVVNFGKYSVQRQCVGRTPGFWRNCHGIQIIQQGSYWDELVALNLATMSGSHFDPTGNVHQWRCWMQGGNAWNMSYMLSVHLAAMQLNVLSGRVSPNCWVSTPSGPTTIHAVMQAANIALGIDRYTPPGDPRRALQQQLKNILDAANNNRNWL